MPKRANLADVKTPEQRGPIGAWAYDARDSAALSPEQVVERLALAGIEVRASTIRGIESGSKQPGRALLKSLAGLYGSRPPEARPEPEEPGLLGAINALVVALDADREERRALTRAIAGLAGSLAMTPEVEELLAQLALRETAG